MTLGKVIRAQEGIPTPQSGCPTTNMTWIDQKHAQNSMFGSVKGSDSCHIGNQSLYFHYMTLSKAIRAQEEVPT